MSDFKLNYHCEACVFQPHPQALIFHTGRVHRGQVEVTVLCRYWGWQDAVCACMQRFLVCNRHDFDGMIHVTAMQLWA